MFDLDAVIGKQTLVNDGMTTDLLNLHQTVNLPIDVAALNSPTGVFRYFVRLTDNKQRKLTTLQRATQFKGIVKNKGRLVRLVDDTLQIVEDIILLDSNFDLLIDDRKNLLLQAGNHSNKLYLCQS